MQALRNQFSANPTRANIEIDYEHNQEFESNPFLIMVSGREFLRFRTYAEAEAAIQYHTYFNSIPDWEPIDSLDKPQNANIEFFQSIQNETTDVEIFIYRVDNLMIGYLQVDMGNGVWANGDGNNYPDWREAGYELVKAINKDTIHLINNIGV